MVKSLQKRASDQWDLEHQQRWCWCCYHIILELNLCTFYCIVCLHVYHTWASACRGQGRASNLLELELTGSCNPGNQTQLLYDNSMLVCCCYFLRQGFSICQAGLKLTDLPASVSECWDQMNHHCPQKTTFSSALSERLALFRVTESKNCLTVSWALSEVTVSVRLSWLDCFVSVCFTWHVFDAYFQSGILLFCFMMWILLGCILHSQSYSCVISSALYVQTICCFLCSLWGFMLRTFPQVSVSLWICDVNFRNM